MHAVLKYSWQVDVFPFFCVADIWNLFCGCVFFENVTNWASSACRFALRRINGLYFFCVVLNWANWANCVLCVGSWLGAVSGNKNRKWNVFHNKLHFLQLHLIWGKCNYGLFNFKGFCQCWGVNFMGARMLYYSSFALNLWNSITFLFTNINGMVSAHN